MKTLANCSWESHVYNLATTVGCCIIRQNWESDQQTECKHAEVGGRGPSEEKNFSEINFKIGISSPSNSGCLLSVRGSLPSRFPSHPAQFRGPHLCRRNWGERARDTGSWKDPKVIPVFWRFSYETDGNGCVPQLLHPLRRLKINNTKITQSIVVLLEVLPPVSCVIKWLLRAKKKKKPK